MSGNAQGWAWSHGPVTKWGRSHLGVKLPDRCAQTVLVAIGDGANHAGEHSYPGLASLIDGTGYSRRAVLSAIERLIGWGYLIVEEKGGGRGRATVYGMPGVSDASWRPKTVQDLHLPEEPNGADTDDKRCSPDVETVQTEDVAPLFATKDQRGTSNSPGRFDEHFWPVYPARDGKKVGKAKALAEWSKLSIEDQRAAVKGARNYAASGWRPKDAERWLRDRCFDEWQTPATPTGNGGRGRQTGFADVMAEIREEMAQ